MKGLRLFVRPASSADEDTIAPFLAREGGGDTCATTGLPFIGKLIGELVAVADVRIDAGALAIEKLVVASELRGKRIGTVMLREIESWGIRHNVSRVTVKRNALPEPFVERCGFTLEDGVFVRKLKAES